MTTSSDEYKDQLVKAIQESGAVRFGKFTLKSGQESNWIANLKETALDARFTHTIAHGIWNALAEFPEVTHVGAVAMGGIPLMSCVVHLSGTSVPFRPICGFYVRAEAKDHGTGKLVDGVSPTGKHCAMIEDVTTTSGSLLRSIDNAEAEGAKFSAAIAVLDRGDDTAAKFAERGIAYRALITKHDLGLS